MIKGLYEAHLPVRNRRRAAAFYEKLGLELTYEDDRVTFFWIEKGKSWLGLWECKEAELPYHPSIRHLAFRVDYEDMKKAKVWLAEQGIAVREAFGIQPREPIVSPDAPHAHAALYFYDPDGNSLEFICPLELDTYPGNKGSHLYLSEWEEKIKDR